MPKINKHTVSAHQNVAADQAKNTGALQIEGRLEAFHIIPQQGWALKGWALNSERPEQRLSIEVLCNKRPVGFGVANLPRPDLGAIDLKGQDAGFFIMLPADSLESGDNVLDVLANGTPMPGSPLHLNAVAPSQAKPPRNVTNGERDKTENSGAPESTQITLPSLVKTICGIQIYSNSDIFDCNWYHKNYLSTEAGNLGAAIEPYFHYLLTGKAKGNFPHMPFDEGWYIWQAPDVVRDIAAKKYINAFHHYLEVGASGGFSPIHSFDERWYLEQYADVRAAVEQKRFISGYHHYALIGKQEKRRPHPRLPNGKPPGARGQAASVADTYEGGRWLKSRVQSYSFQESPQFAEELYRDFHGDVEGAVRIGLISSGCRHWLDSGMREDFLGLRPRIPGFVESRYLGQNPDVGALVGNGSLPSGYHHFLMYGWAEKRPGGVESDVTPERRIDHAGILARLREWKNPPLISIIVPVYETDRSMLEACINSVRTQLYPHWELCLCDDGSADPGVHDILLHHQREDSRVKVTFLSGNSGISAASNAALATATGDWIALLDHDDELTPDALYEVAAAVADDPALDVIYSDEDKMSADGQRCFGAAYKPGWSPELLRSTMYIGHLTTYRAELLRKAGGWRSAFDGTQDYDLALRITERTDRIHHIPKILYHWRLSPTSTAQSLTNKPYVLKRQQLALTSALARAGVQGKVKQHYSPGNWRVTYAPPAHQPMVSIVIPTAGYTVPVEGRRLNLLSNCVQSLIDSECYNNYEIVVVHNGDLTDAIEKYLSNMPQVRLVHYKAKHFNFSEKINLGVQEARGEYVLLLNDDMEVITPRFLHDMVGLASQPGVGAVGCRLLFANHSIQHTGIVLMPQGPTHLLIREQRLTPGPMGMAQLPHNAIAATGACLLMRRDLYCELGGFDVSLPLNYNDVDLCLRIRARGLRIAVDPGIELYHFESLSKAGTFNWESQKFLERWADVTDPYYNANFLQTTPFCEVRPAKTKPETSDFMTTFLQRLRHRRPRQVQETIKFSFFLSVYNTPAKFLRELEATIFNQYYANFEWVVVDNGSRNADTVAWCDAVRSHPKVVFIRLEKNAGIMGGYGTAFRAATGDYVLPVDADDFLTLDALSFMAEAISRNGRPAALYSDECKSDERSGMFSPFHKTDWDPILFSNICYVAHLCAVRRDVALEIGAYQDDKATWCHDWDTFWRVSRSGGTIVHVPEVLYAWRINPGSTASIESSGKPETVVSQLHVLSQNLALTGRNTLFEVAENTLFDHGGIWCLKPIQNPPVRIVWDARGIKEEMLLERLQRLYEACGKTHSCTVIVDDERLVDVTAGLGNNPRIEITHADRIVQALASVVENDLIAWIGKGIQLPDGPWLEELSGLLHGVDDAVLAGGRVANENGRLMWAGGYFGFGGFLDSPDAGRSLDDSGYHGFAFCQRTVDAVCASHWVARGSFLASVLDRLDPTANEYELATALSLMARARQARVLYTPFSLVWSTARSVRPAMPSAALLERLGVPVPDASPYYNPRLSNRIGKSYQLSPESPVLKVSIMSEATSH
nr:glycosyltransferase [Azospirillum sp. 412522]